MILCTKSPDYHPNPTYLFFRGQHGVLVIAVELGRRRRLLAASDDGGVECAPLLDSGEVSLSAVHRVVVPGREEERGVLAPAPVQLLPQLGGQGVVQSD